MKKQKTIFLDRDGVINIDKHYLYKKEDFEFREKLFEICRYLQRIGYQIIIITNQSGIGRKYFKESDFYTLTTWMMNQFQTNGINILDIFYCPHTPEDNCTCRKPKIGMILNACNKYSIDLNNSWMIGDKISDIDLAHNAGISNSILISSEYTNDINQLKTNNVINSLIQIKNIIKG